jgi:hypothetical protein
LGFGFTAILAGPIVPRSEANLFRQDNATKPQDVILGLFSF